MKTRESSVTTGEIFYLRLKFSKTFFTSQNYKNTSNTHVTNSMLTILQRRILEIVLVSCLIFLGVSLYPKRYCSALVTITTTISEMNNL